MFPFLRRITTVITPSARITVTSTPTARRTRVSGAALTTAVIMPISTAIDEIAVIITPRVTQARMMIFTGFACSSYFALIRAKKFLRSIHGPPFKFSIDTYSVYLILLYQIIHISSNYVNFIM